jgi:hypothetical protein
MDESGTPDIPGNTSHYILCGFAIPIWQWKNLESQISSIKYKYSLQDKEIHAGWLLRPYVEQNMIMNFEKMNHIQRRDEVEKQRKIELYNLQRTKRNTHYKQTKKNYRLTEPYIHLTYMERKNFIEEVAKLIGEIGYVRLFAECIDKVYFNPTRTSQTIDEQAFEQVISRFEQFLKLINSGQTSKCYGLLIHDNNITVARKHTALMRKFHQTGTLWIQIENIIETPLFVDSALTSMIQLGDVCAYALRRYLENQEEGLFNHVFKRADKKDSVVVGVRHFTAATCSCKICKAHKILNN